jgi:hypothetical protein
LRIWTYYFSIIIVNLFNFKEFPSRTSKFENLFLIAIINLHIKLSIFRWLKFNFDWTLTWLNHTKCRIDHMDWKILWLLLTTFSWNKFQIIITIILGFWDNFCFISITLKSYLNCVLKNVLWPIKAYITIWTGKCLSFLLLQHSITTLPNSCYICIYFWENFDPCSQRFWRN